MKFSLSCLWIASLLPSSGVSATAIATPKEPRHAAPESPAALQGKSGFSLSCPDYWFTPKNAQSSLQANCFRANGKTILTTLFLNNCVANVKGKLRGRKKGNYGESCDTQSCSLQGTSFECQCKDAGGRWVTASVDLNTFITNYDGKLTCFSRDGF